METERAIRPGCQKSTKQLTSQLTEYENYFQFVYMYSNPSPILHNYFTTINLFVRLRNCSIGIHFYNIFYVEKNNVFDIVLVAPILSLKYFSALK